MRSTGGLHLTLCLVAFVPVPRAAVPQDLPDQEEAGQEAAPEPPHPLLDPHAHRQHHQVRRSSHGPPSCFAAVPGGVLGFGRSFDSCFVCQVQREAQALAPHQARILSGGRDAGHRCLGKLGFTSRPRDASMFPHARGALV